MDHRLEPLPPETEADIVHELRTGMLVWFCDTLDEGFREIAHIDTWTATPHTYQRDLAEHWTTVTYTDGYSHSRPRYGSHEIWKSGPQPMIGA